MSISQAQTNCSVCELVWLTCGRPSCCRGTAPALQLVSAELLSSGGLLTVQSSPLEALPLRGRQQAGSSLSSCLSSSTSCSVTAAPWSTKAFLALLYRLCRGLDRLLGAVDTPLPRAAQRVLGAQKVRKGKGIQVLVRGIACECHSLTQFGVVKVSVTQPDDASGCSLAWKHNAPASRSMQSIKASKLRRRQHAIALAALPVVDQLRPRVLCRQEIKLDRTQNPQSHLEAMGHVLSVVSMRTHSFCLVSFRRLEQLRGLLRCTSTFPYGRHKITWPVPIVLPAARTSSGHRCNVRSGCKPPCFRVHAILPTPRKQQAVLSEHVLSLQRDSVLWSCSVLLWCTGSGSRSTSGCWCGSWRRSPGRCQGLV